MSAGRTVVLQYAVHKPMSGRRTPRRRTRASWRAPGEPMPRSENVAEGRWRAFSCDQPVSALALSWTNRAVPPGSGKTSDARGRPPPPPPGPTPSLPHSASISPACCSPLAASWTHPSRSRISGRSGRAGCPRRGRRLALRRGPRSAVPFGTAFVCSPRRRTGMSYTRAPPAQPARGSSCAARSKGPSSR